VLTPVTALSNALAADPQAEGAADQARSVSSSFAAALQKDGEDRAAALLRRIGWAAGSGPGLPQDRQAALAALRQNLDDLRGASGRTQAATDPGQALAEARAAIAPYRALGPAITAIAALDGSEKKQDADLALAKRKAAEQAAAARKAAATPVSTVAPAVTTTAVAAAPSSGDQLSGATTSQFNAIVNEGRDMARQVIRMGDRARPGSGPDGQANYELLRQNAQLARTYDSSLAALKNSFRGVQSDRQADPLIKQAKQTRAYLVFLVKRSTDASR